MPKFKSLLVALLILFFPGSFAQTVKDSEKISTSFYHAIQLYDSSKFEAAWQIFNGIMNTDDDYSPQKTISYIFAGKSLAALKNYEAGKNTLNEFLIRFPSSNYTDEAKLTLTEIFVEQKNYNLAFNELISLINSSKSPFYLSYAMTNAENIARNYLSTWQIKFVYDSLSGDKTKPFVLLVLGKSYLQNNKRENAENSFLELLKLYPESEEKGEAATLYNHIEDEKRLTDSPLIAALFPLYSAPNGEDYITASEILEGIKFAFSEYNKQNERKVGLVIKNTGRNKEQIEKIKDELIKFQSLKAVIGPIYSDEVKMTLKAFKNTGIPVISPTATDDSLTDVYPNFFQANPSFLIRGRILAEYIYFVENKSKMAVLNSIDNYSATIANSFIKEFENIGGEIIIHQTFNSNSLSFDEQIAKIVDDSLQIDGLFIPLFNKNIVPYLLSQFAKYNFELPLYGNQDWFLAKGYESYPVLSNKLTFSSDYFLDYSDTSFQSFSKRFVNQTNKEVNRNVLYGYDAAEFLLSEVKDFNISPTEIKNEIVAGTIFNGYHNRIYFDKSRINKFVNILRYKDGKFELVDKFKLSK
jgi:branched-chain amino acid transport system substrate-binding protein